MLYIKYIQYRNDIANSQGGLMSDLFKKSSLQALQVANSFEKAGSKLMKWDKVPSFSSNTPKTRRMKTRFLQ